MIKYFCWFAAFIPLAAAEDAHNQQSYQLKMDEEVTKILHEAAAKKVYLSFSLELDYTWILITFSLKI